MVTTRASILGLATALALCDACSRQNPASAMAAAPAPVTDSDECPLSDVRGVAVHVDDAPGGVAIVFRVPERALGLLRSNVRAMAAASLSTGNPFVVCPCGEPQSGEIAHAVHDTSGGGFGVTSMQAPSSWTALLPPLRSIAVRDDSDVGATLVLRAADEGDLEALRAEARRLVSVMGGCLQSDRRVARPNNGSRN